MQDTVIQMSHGGGGGATSQLIQAVFASRLGNAYLQRQEDAAVIAADDLLSLSPQSPTPTGQGSQIAMTTDTFVVTPLFFPGGDIGRLAIAGTVNDLLMMGARPRYLTAGFILEEGLLVADLERIVDSMAQTAAEAGVVLVAADTKVVEGKGGVMINTTGLGVVDCRWPIGADQARPGDAILVSGPLGDHQACIMSHRLGIHNSIQSDAAPLQRPVRALLDLGLPVHSLRDITRGGLATVLNELVQSSRCGAELSESSIPVRPETQALCDVLGLDPLAMANEGKFVIILPQTHAAQALDLLRQYPESAGAVQIGAVTDGSGVVLATSIGGRRLLAIPWYEGLPRIC